MKVKRDLFFYGVPVHLTNKTKYRNCESILYNFNEINEENRANIEKTLVDFLDHFEKEPEIRDYIKQENINKLELNYVEVRENKGHKERYSEIIGSGRFSDYIIIMHKNDSTFRYLIYPADQTYKKDAKIWCNRQCTYNVYFEYFIGENHCPIKNKCKKCKNKS